MLADDSRAPGILVQLPVKTRELGSGPDNGDSCTGQECIGYVKTGVWREQRGEIVK